MTKNFSISPLTGNIGAEVGNIDIGKFATADVPQLKDALNKYQVLFFRDQHITPQQQAAFAAHFGQLTESLVDAGGSPAPHVLRIETSDGRDGNDVWHTDHSFSKRPPKMGMLRAVTMPSHGGDTMWANMYKAYEDLSPHMQEFLDGLTATHSTDRMMPRVMRRYKDKANFKFDRSEVTHPLIVVHPETGRKILYVNALYTMHINELTRDESDALLAFLFKHTMSPLYQVRFKWRENSVAIWDEESTIHFVVPDYFETRVMHRTTVDGSEPFGTQRTRRA